jgi:hypothetical protein
MESIQPSVHKFSQLRVIYISVNRVPTFQFHPLKPDDCGNGCIGIGALHTNLYELNMDITEQ